jgi:hypothetical protein
LRTEDRAALYNARFPARPPLAHGNDWVVGTWCVGACYKNPNRLYGAYPYGYLARVHSMFPDASKILHVFSGGLTVDNAIMAAAESEASAHELPLEATGPHEVELVDLHGPEAGRHPTWQGDATAMPQEWAGRFDLILADPPYGDEDAAVYDTPMPQARLVMRELRRVAALGCNLVWLDQKWPMHKKTQWRTWGHIGLVRSTNHRMRLVSLFEAV